MSLKYNGKLVTIKSRPFFFYSLFFISSNLSAQNDVLAILQKSQKASSQINNGTYDAHLQMKYLERNDTLMLNGHCRFQRYSADSLIGAKFEIEANNTHILYDGRKKITLFSKDSLAIVHDKWKYTLKLTGSIYHLLSDYLLNGDNDFDETIKNPETKKHLLKDTVIYGNPCYHILLHPADDETSQDVYEHLFISKDNFFLIGEVLNLDAHQHHQYNQMFLQNVKTNTKSLDDNYGTDLIPAGFYIKQYLPDQLTQLLQTGTTAPPFTLTSLEGKTASMNMLKGSIVILYFWGAAYQQSRVRLLPIQKIYEKYSTKGVEVFGMNVDGGNNEHLKKLLENKKVTFTQLTEAANTGEKYNLTEIPTLYVIGKNGKIIEGFVPDARENIEEKLEKIILKNQ